MKIFLLTLVLFAQLAGAFSAPAAELKPEFSNPPTPVVNYESGQVREFRVTLLDERGQPVVGVPVELYGMERGGRWPELDAPKAKSQDAWWSFTTDDHGTIVARFAVSKEPWDHSVPRKGKFYFVAELPDGRRAISPPIFHEVTREDAHEIEEDEWDVHSDEGRIFTNEIASTTLHLEKGMTVTGTVVSPEGKPIKGTVISAVHDLHAQSPTGAGGEIFSVKATSDAEGKFILKHVYPASCGLSMNGEGHWSRTRVALHAPDRSKTRWVEGSPKLPELSSDTKVDLKIEVIPVAPKYRYFGTVTDESGKPMTGLYVIAGVSQHASPETWGDYHSFDNAITDAAGRWEIQTWSPWVRFFDVRTTEFGDSLLEGEDYESDDLGLAAPGEYHLKVGPATLTLKDK